MIRARIALPAGILILLALLFSITIKPAHADFCLTQAQLAPLYNADLSKMTKEMRKDGTVLYCFPEPAGSQQTPNPASATYDPNKAALQSVGGCPPGAHPATPDDVIKMKAANITDAREGMCWDPKDPTVGKTFAEAKQYLRSILCKADGDNYGGMGPDGTIQGLDAKFAVCAASFLKAANQNGQVCLKEGKRSTAKQEEYARRPIIACKKGALCEHPRGIAIDVNVVPSQKGCGPYERLFSLAPQFGLKFYLGCKDAYHFVPAVGGCNAGGTAAGIGANSPLPANNFDYPQYYGNPASTTQSPLTGLLNGLRSMLGMSPITPQPIQPLYTPPISPNQPINSNPSSSTLSTTNTGTNSDSLQLPTLPDTSGYSTSSNSSTNINSNSDIDYINSLASSLAPSTQGSSNTSGPAQLNQNLGDVQSAGNTVVNANPVTYQYPITFPAEITSTFGSPNTAGNIVYSPGPESTYQQFLGRLKGALQIISTLLQPFGGRAQNQQIID